MRTTLSSTMPEEVLRDRDLPPWTETPLPPDRDPPGQRPPPWAETPLPGQRPASEQYHSQVLNYHLPETSFAGGKHAVR